MSDFKNQKMGLRSLKVRAFGAFRKYIPESELILEVEGEPTVEMVKLKIAEVLALRPGGFPDLALLKDSALATENEVLFPESRISGNVVAILPPVCGG